MSREDQCAGCKKEIGPDAYCNWIGPPFSQRANREICFTCLCALRPEVIKHGESEIAFLGSYSGDVMSLSEMLDDGFEKDESIRSIKAIGKILGLPAFTIKKRLKN